MSFTHFNDQGRAQMVEVTEKEDTLRVAVARGMIQMKPSTIEAIQGKGIKKGDVLSVAQVAGIMGAKRTSDLVPMCHPLMLTGVDIRFDVQVDRVLIEAVVKTTGKTGVEMEALHGVSIGLLTIYDMCKAVDKNMPISDIKLIEKTKEDL